MQFDYTELQGLQKYVCFIMIDAPPKAINQQHELKAIAVLTQYRNIREGLFVIRYPFAYNIL